MHNIPVFLLKVLISTTLCHAISPITYNDAYQYLSSLGIITNKNFFKQSPFLSEYDFIVIGAGAGGATIANRLSENPEWSVLLLEAGPEESVVLRIPAFEALALETPIDWNYVTEPQDNACLAFKERRCAWPRGKELGGSTGINAMIYRRGHRNDYNEWAEMGNRGWSYEEVLPYFLKTEKASYELVTLNTTSPYHSRTGNVAVQPLRFNTKIGEAVLQGLSDINFSRVDYNDGNLRPGTYSPPQVMQEHSLRCSAARAYLDHARFRANLDVKINSYVTKIVIDPVTKTATGVIVSKNLQDYFISARKEVILSAGPLNSPQLLMLSGVGPEDHLQELGIPVIQNLPVGRNFHDHVNYGTLVFTVEGTNVAANPETLFDPKSLLKLFAEGKGPLSSNGMECLAYISTKYNTDIRPDVEIVFTSATFLDDGDARKHFYRITDDIYNTVYKPHEGLESWTAAPILLRPKSIGYIKLRSSNPWDAPLFYPNYLQEEDDVNRLVEAIKFIVKFSQSPSILKYGSKLIDTKLPPCKAFDFGSDDYWRCAVKHFGYGYYHQCGTCKMGPPGDPTAVVSPELKVYGINNLRVIDASVLPKIVSAHLTAPVFMIAEKAADIIKSTYAGEVRIYKK